MPAIQLEFIVCKPEEKNVLKGVTKNDMFMRIIGITTNNSSLFFVLFFLSFLQKKLTPLVSCICESLISHH
jgi:hypothetical protein